MTISKAAINAKSDAILMCDFIIVGAILTKATEIKGLRFIFPLLATLTMMLSYYGWIWTAGIAMHKQYFSDRKPNLNTFKLLFVLALFLFLIVTPILRTILSDDYRYLIQLVGLAALFSFLYCIYFTVKAIRDVEKQRNIKTNSIPLDFILIWFLPIGIWIIQPRIFRILTHKEENIQQPNAV